MESVPTSFLITEPSTEGDVPLARFLCAHGAGAGIETPFLTAMAGLLAQRGIATYRFAFAYMTAQQHGGTRRPPRAESLIDEFRAAAAAMPTDVPVLIGGKSMGGRVASLVADELHGRGCIAGLVCLGYPFHPPNKPDQLRTRHLLNLACPALFVQGERDPFGTRAEVETFSLSPPFAWCGRGMGTTIWRRGAEGDQHPTIAPLRPTRWRSSRAACDSPLAERCNCSRGGSPHHGRGEVRCPRADGRKPPRECRGQPLLPNSRARTNADPQEAMGHEPLCPDTPSRGRLEQLLSRRVSSQKMRQPA